MAESEVTKQTWQTYQMVQRRDARTGLSYDTYENTASLWGRCREYAHGAHAHHRCTCPNCPPELMAAPWKCFLTNQWVTATDIISKIGVPFSELLRERRR